MLATESHSLLNSCGEQVWRDGEIQLRSTRTLNGVGCPSTEKLLAMQKPSLRTVSEDVHVEGCGGRLCRREGLVSGPRNVNGWELSPSQLCQHFLRLRLVHALRQEQQTGTVVYCGRTNSKTDKHIKLNPSNSALGIDRINFTMMVRDLDSIVIPEASKNGKSELG